MLPPGINKRAESDYSWSSSGLLWDPNHLASLPHQSQLALALLSLHPHIGYKLAKPRRWNHCVQRGRLATSWAVCFPIRHPSSPAIDLRVGGERGSQIGRTQFWIQVQVLPWNWCSHEDVFWHFKGLLQASIRKGSRQHYFSAWLALVYMIVCSASTAPTADISQLRSHIQTLSSVAEGFGS